MFIIDDILLIGGAVLATLAEGAVLVGELVITLSASALAAASAIGGIVLVGGITIANVVAWGGGIFAVAAFTGAIAEDAREEGRKEGYGQASREYEAKLRNQAKEFFTQIAELKAEIEGYKLQRDKAQELAKKAFILLGRFEGCIKAIENQGGTVQDETLGYYKQLKDFTDEAA